MAKSNFPLGEVSNPSFDNGVTKVGSPKSGQGGGSYAVFEPDDRYKGDFARTYFYMACAYQHYQWRYTYMLNNSSWKTLNEWSIDLLCRWARNDAVSDKEVDRCSITRTTATRSSTSLSCLSSSGATVRARSST